MKLYILKGLYKFLQKAEDFICLMKAEAYLAYKNLEWDETLKDY